MSSRLSLLVVPNKVAVTSQSGQPLILAGNADDICLCKNSRCEYPRDHFEYRLSTLRKINACLLADMIHQIAPAGHHFDHHTIDTLRAPMCRNSFVSAVSLGSTMRTPPTSVHITIWRIFSAGLTMQHFLDLALSFTSKRNTTPRLEILTLSCDLYCRKHHQG